MDDDSPPDGLAIEPRDKVVVIEKRRGPTRFYLAHRLTGEVVQLSTHGGVRELGFDENGVGFCVDEHGNPCWVNSLFTQVLHRREASNKLYVVEGDTVKDLRSYLSTAEERTVQLNAVGADSLCLDAHVFQRPFLRQKIWWSLSRIFLALGFSGQPSKRYMPRFVKWARSLELWGWPSTPFLRRAEETKQTLAAAKADPWQSACRCLAVYTCCTLALIALATRWSKEATGSRRSPAEGAADRPAAWRMLLTALLQKAAGTFTVVYACQRPKNDRGEEVADEMEVSLKCTSSCVDVHELRVCPYCPPVPYLLSETDGDDVGMVDLLIALERSGSDGAGLFVAMCEALAVEVERALLQEQGFDKRDDGVAEPEVAQNTAGPKPAWTVTAARRRKAIAAYEENKEKARETLHLQQHFFAAREAFSGSQNLCMSIDGSRIGNRKMAVSMFGSPGGVCTIGPPQVLKDFSNAASEAIAEGDAAALQTERERHRAKAEEFLEGQSGKKEEEVQPLYRQDALSRLMCVQNVLHCLAGRKLDDFIVEQSQNHKWLAQPSSWRSLSIAIDQGADGWAACNFLLHQASANVTVLPDASHRVWNDCLLPVSDSKMSGPMFGFIVLLNTDSGPWETARVFHQARGASDTYMEVANERCPLFQRYLDKIVDDADCGERRAEEGLERDLFDSLRGAFRRKTSRVPMSRWFSFFDSMERLLKVWHAKLVQLLYLAISLGWMSSMQWGGQGEAAMREQLQVGQDGDVEKPSTQRERDEVKKMRQSCRNTLHFSITLLMEDTLRRVLKGMTALVGPLRQWDSKSLKDAQSMEDGLQWYKDQATGEAMTPLFEIAGQLNDKSFWEYVGIWTGVTVAPARDHDHPAALADCDLAGRIFTFGLSLMARRMRTVMWHMCGYPGSLVMVLDGDAAETKVTDMGELYEIWKTEVRPLKGAFWNKFKQRSVFNTAGIALVLEQARLDGWKPTESLRTIARNKFCVIFGTKGVEDCFHEGRCSERQTSNCNRRVKAPRFWHRLLCKQVHRKRRSYKELLWRRVRGVKGVTAKKLKACFAPQLHSLSKEMRSLRGPNSTPSWFSPAPLNICVQDFDILLMQACSGTDKWASMKNLWLSCVVRGSQLLVKLRGGSTQWYYSLGDYGNMCVVGWPVDRFDLGGYTYFRLSENLEFKDLLIVFMYDPLEWQAMAVECCSILGMYGRGVDIPDIPGVILRPSSVPMCLMKVVASRCFGSWPKTTVCSIAKHFQVPLPSGCSLVGALTQLARKFLPDATDQALVRILELRVHMATDEVTDFLLTKDAEDMMHEEDKDELKKIQKESNGILDDAQLYTKELKAKRAELQPASEPAAKKTKGQQKQEGRGKVAAPELDDRLTEERLNSWFPPNTRAWADTWNSRWQLFYDRRRCQSFAWNRYGFVGAARMSLLEVWKLHQQHGGEIPEHIQKLAEVRVSSATASEGANSSSSASVPA